MRIDVRRGVVSALLVSAMVGLGGGCMTGRPMAFAPGAPPLALGASEGLALGTLKLANVYKTGCMPHASSVTVISSAGSSRFATAPFRESAAENDQYEEVLVSLPLAPGEYTLTEIFARASCGIVFGSGTATVEAPFRVEPGEAVYIGRVVATRRERKGDEPRAGSVIPFIDQAVTGFSGGTFDVRVVDNYVADVALLKSTFAPLANVAVQKPPVGPSARR